MNEHKEQATEQQDSRWSIQPHSTESVLPANDSATFIAGIGSPHGDDRIGWLVAEQLRDFAISHRFCLQLVKSPVDLLDWLEGIDRLVICDACRGLGAVGEIGRWKWPAPDISQVATSGTHNFALPMVLGMAEKLGRLPNDVVIWTIEGAVSQSNTAVSAEVEDAIPRLVNRIANDLDNAHP